MAQLGQAKPRLLCSLVHKFGRKDVDDFDAFIKELEASPARRSARSSFSWTNATARRAASCTA
jgi:hypothetical protein